MARQENMIPPPPSLVKKTIESAPRGGFILSGVEREVDFALFFAKDGAGWAAVARQDNMIPPHDPL